MAGRRRTLAQRKADQIERRYKAYVAEMAKAKTPGAQVGAAAKYLRSILAITPRQVAVPVAETAVEELLNHANQLIEGNQQ